MAKNISGKSNKTVNSRSHANNKTKRTQKVNLQKVTINGVKVKLSAREKKTLGV